MRRIRWFDWKRDPIILVCLIIAWWPKPSWTINYIVDAIVIPIGLWFAWPGVKWLFTVQKHL